MKDSGSTAQSRAANSSSADEDELEEDEYEEDEFEEEDEFVDDSKSKEEPPTIIIDKGLLRISDAGQVRL